MPKNEPAGRKRSKSRRRITPASLTPAEQATLSFPFESLKTSQALSLKKLLGKLIAKGVSLDALGDALFYQRILDGRNSVRTREAWEAWVRDLTRFAKARRRLQKRGAALDAPALGVRPPAFRELLDALSRALEEVSQRAVRMVELLKARELKQRTRREGGHLAPGAPRREKAALPPGIGRDDARKLFSAVRVASRHAPLGEPTIRYDMPPPCPRCGNPAPELFRNK
jgi:hypothetical protein